MKVFSALFVLAASSHALAQGSAAAAPVLSLERTGDGLPKCGLGKSFHAGRREALRAALGAGVVIVRGLPDTRDYRPFRQDKVFWYLTGVESPNAWLVMDCKSGREVLLLADPDKSKEGWEGELWDTRDGWVKELTGFGDVRSSSEFEKLVGELLGKKATLWLSMHPNLDLSGAADRARPYDDARKRDPFDGRPGREEALAQALAAKFGREAQDFTPRLDELRRVKTTEEIDALRRAGRAGALAMSEAMRSTAPGVGEWELESLMTWFHVKEGAAGPAYQAIVGSGPNSLVLHYSACNRRARDGEVVLIDYAPEVDHFTSDITRTWPVNGKFDARQAELYDAVYEAQLAGIAAVKPGATFGDVEGAVRAVLQRHGVGNLLPHGVSHFVGMEVHDVGNARRPLVPGACFTIEPGVYERSTGIGIRIEDVVVVTATGCEVLTDGCPKARAEVEALVASQGVLDWLKSR